MTDDDSFVSVIFLFHVQKSYDTIEHPNLKREIMVKIVIKDEINATIGRVAR
jgi:hypothetical protein